MAKPNIADAYLNEEVNFGGIRMPRGRMIAQLQRIAKANGLPLACVDRYLQGKLAMVSRSNPREQGCV